MRAEAVVPSARRTDTPPARLAELVSPPHELAKMGVVLKDSKDGTTWEVAR